MPPQNVCAPRPRAFVSPLAERKRLPGTYTPHQTDLYGGATPTHHTLSTLDSPAAFWNDSGREENDWSLKVWTSHTFSRSRVLVNTFLNNTAMLDQRFERLSLVKQQAIVDHLSVVLGKQFESLSVWHQLQAT